LTSQYLHVNESNDTQYVPPPLAVFSQKSSAAMPRHQFMREHSAYSIEKESSPTELGATALELTDSFDDHSYVNNTVRDSWDRQNQSLGNSSEYARMSGDSSPTIPHSYVNKADDEYSYARNFEHLPPLNGEPRSLQNGTKMKLVKTSSNPTLLDSRPGASVAAWKNGSNSSSPSFKKKSSKIKLVKTSSTPTVLDDNPVASGVATSTGDDYVPASPASAAICHRSASGVSAVSKVSEPASPSTPASDIVSPSGSGSQSPAVVSLVAGVSLSSRSRVFTRQNTQPK